MFKVPYYYPPLDYGTQLFNPGNNGRGGSHPVEQITQPPIHPIVYSVSTYGLGNMPRQVIGVTNPIDVNVFSNPPSISNLEIAGLRKK